MNVATYSPRILSICSGGGGLDAGLKLAVPGARTVCYVEREVTEAGVLAKGIESGWLDDAPIWSDLLTFDGAAWRGRVEGIVGGFPCQPHSYAGKRLGEFDERNLWPAVARLVCDVAPEFCLFENVPGIMAYYWRDIRPDLCALGYEVTEGIFSAAEVGAPHLRERLFILAHRNGVGDADGDSVGEAEDISGWQCVEGQRAQGRAATSESGAGVGDGARWAQAGAGGRLDAGSQPQARGRVFPPGPSDADGWREWIESGESAPAETNAESLLRRGPNGLAWRGDRLRVLGNSVVPLAAAHAWCSLSHGLRTRKRNMDVD